MVGETPDFDGVAFQFLANAAEVGVQFIFNRLRDERLSVLGAIYDVYVVFHERLSHV